MKQEIKTINITDLHLWSENPRDPMDPTYSDYEIIEKAVIDERIKWNLPKLLKEMGPHYDFSELPTVIEEEYQKIVFDGNRRIAILKYLQNKSIYQSFSGGLFPELEQKELLNLKEIPCNVCDRETALDNIERKHSNSGSWTQLDREYFLHRHRKQEKSLFLMFEEATGLISKYKKLNKRFVKEEVLTVANLESIGFKVIDDKLLSIYKDNETKKILDELIMLIENGKIKTRNNEEKGEMRVAVGELKNVFEILSPNFDIKLKTFSTETSQEVTTTIFEDSENSDSSDSGRRTPREKGITLQFFGERLFLVKGDTNSIYMDILDLHEYYLKNINKLSKYFPSMIRMSLRLLVEAATDEGKKIDNYIETNFAKGKKLLTKDQKTSLSNNSIENDQKLIQLLQAGAHNYTNSANIEQTTAMSIIIGAMLKITHSKN